MNRRQFSLLSVGFPTIVKASALGLNGAVPASDRIVMATIGVGGMGQGHIREFLKVPDARIVAVCDVEDIHLIKAKGMVETGYSSPDCSTYRAFEEVLLRRDIDAVSIALPDHWHGIVAVRAAQAGKDIYGEKPLAPGPHPPRRRGHPRGGKTQQAHLANGKLAALAREFPARL